MKERLQELAREAGFYANPDVDKFEKFAQLIVQECIDTLLFHGCDDDVRYIEWMAANKLGVKL